MALPVVRISKSASKIPPMTTDQRISDVFFKMCENTDRLLKHIVELKRRVRNLERDL